MSSLITKLLSTTGGVVAAETDPDFANVSLLLHGDGTNGAQNNTFLDSSANGFTITRNGNTTQGSYSPYRSEWSVYFDASAVSLGLDYTTATHTYWDNDFTLEFWVNSTATATVSALFNSWADANLSGGSYGMNFTSAGLVGMFHRQSSGTNQTFFITGSTAVNDGKWHHVALTQTDDGSTKTFRLFVDGVLDAYTTETSWTQINANQFIYLGGQNPISYDETNRRLVGYMSDLRLVKDIVYSTASTTVGTTVFTPPIEPLTAITNTEILALQANRFIDQSSNNYAITSSGNGKVTPFSPYAPSDAYDPANEGGSGYFDGTGDYLTSANAVSAFDFGSSDFTIEFWINSTKTTRSDPVGWNYGFSGAGWAGFIFNLSASGDMAWFENANNRISASGTNWNDGAWHHVSVTRSGNSVRMFLDGTQVGSTYTTSHSYGAANSGIIIGNITGSTQYVDGYMSDVRFIKGTALYTTSFTPPTAPLTAVTNTSLLCSFTNAGIFDSTGKNVIETVGNAQIDTTTVKYGTGAMEFAAYGDYLIADGVDLLSDFTIEGWANTALTGDNRFAIVQGLNVTNGFLVSLTTQAIRFRSNGTQDISAAISKSGWYHFAITRSGSGTNNVKVFVDGTQVTQGTYTNDILASVGKLEIGSTDSVNSNFSYTGYLDDIRITKGVARYTANFTPPTKAFPDQ